ALATNPLQLTFMIALWAQDKLQLPASRDELYQQITIHLLGQRVGDPYHIHLYVLRDAAFHHLFCRYRKWEFDAIFLRERIQVILLEDFRAKWKKIGLTPLRKEIGKYLESLDQKVECIKQELVSSGLLTPVKKNVF